MYTLQPKRSKPTEANFTWDVALDALAKDDIGQPELWMYQYTPTTTSAKP